MGILSTNPQIYYAAGGDHGNYRYITLTEIMDSFRAAYVGKDKICERVLDNDITFHALRAMQELSYDTLKSIKSQEIEIPPALIMTLPHDYVNYVKLTWTDGSGIEHIIHPVSKTSNPFAIDQDADGTYNFDFGGDATMDQSFDLISSCVDKIYNKEEVWAAADCTKKEIGSFLEQMNSAQFKDIEKFFETMPKLSHTVKVKNPKTKVENEIVLEGLSSFFG